MAIDKSKEAMKLALEALELSSVTVDSFGVQKKTQEAITALREALAEQPAQQQSAERWEPVAWRTFDGEGGYDYRTYDMNENYAKEWDKQNPKHKGWVEPLYTSLQPAQPQQEPVGYFSINDHGRWEENENQYGMPFYAHPKAQPEQQRPQNCGTGYCSCIECVMK